jgi:iron-sulfur cluster repair protein YtfE (RIC family)
VEKPNESSRSETIVTTSGFSCSDMKMQNGRSSRLTLELQAEHRRIAHEVTLLRETIEQFSLEHNSKALSVSNKLERLFTKHRAKEERIMYPLLRKCLGSNVCTTLSFEHERIHELMRKAIKQISGYEKFLKGSISDLDGLLCGHFSREENVLFWYLDLHYRVRTQGRFETDFAR